mmetsp:Transcript_35282/g.64546  ORF Transcript_35282/g.64546 Transcript_35282/m.64546 type:complete len:287 (+) Transcript_35282:156-1016(+)
MATAGRMDGGFFVSRSELLSWVNNTLDLHLSKVEQCANGAVYCQVIDVCHPGGVTMKRVNWMARPEHEAIPNYKVLQQAFDRCKIDKHVDVDKLVRGKYQDNLEMLQWIKTYFDRTYAGADYDGPSRRFGELPEWAQPKDGVVRRKEIPASPPTRQGYPMRTEDGDRSSGDIRQANRESRTSVGSRPSSSGYGGGAPPGARAVNNGSEHQRLKEEHERMKEELVDLKITVDGLETERDFYFQKLRDIEILCQALEAMPNPNITVEKFVEDVQRVLYAKDDEEDNQA